MDLSMSIIDDDNQLGRILERKNMIKYKLINLPMEQPDDSDMSIRVSEWLQLWIREVRWGWHHMKGIQQYGIRKLTLSNGLLCLPPGDK